MAGTGKRTFGSIRKLPSGRFQARYTGPDGATYTGRSPEGRALTFDARTYAEKYLERVSADIQRGLWEPPGETAAAASPVLFGTYARSWLAGRDLADRTRGNYARLLDGQILPAFGMSPLGDITPAMVREWHAGLRNSKGKRLGPTMRAHAYSLVCTIMSTAVADEVIAASPCRIRGAGTVKRARKIRPATLEQLGAIAAAMPAGYQLMVLLAAWCALRFGEITELRRGDIDVRNGVVHVRRGVVTINGAGRKVKAPKSEAGKRDVAIPPHLMPAVRDHLREHVRPAQDALLFPAVSGGQLAPSSLFKMYKPAREAAGRPDLRFHDLRHTGAVLAAATGATLAELMARLGHTSVSAAMRYQHAAADRDKVIAEALSRLAAGSVTPISSAKGKRKKRQAG